MPVVTTAEYTKTGRLEDTTEATKGTMPCPADGIRLWGTTY